MSRFSHMAEEGRPNLISNRSCIGIAVRLKQLTASVSTWPFQMQHAIFQTELTASIRQSRLVAVWTEVKERSAVTGDGNSQDQLRLIKSKVTLALTCQFRSCREVGSALKEGWIQLAHEVRRVLINHTAETGHGPISSPWLKLLSRVSVPWKRMLESWLREKNEQGTLFN